MIKNIFLLLGINLCDGFSGFSTRSKLLESRDRDIGQLTSGIALGIQ